MRKRTDDNGYDLSFHNMVFDDIPDNYSMKKVITDKMYDYSYMGILKELRDDKSIGAFIDDKSYSKELIYNLALDYIRSACFLGKEIISERENIIISYYTIPCMFLCKHSIELLLKSCLLEKGSSEIKGHSVKTLWDELDESEVPNYDDITSFLTEVEEIDRNEMALRYGISSKLKPLSEKQNFDIDNMINNTMYLFNVLEEYVICKYKY